MDINIDFYNPSEVSKEKKIMKISVLMCLAVGFFIVSSCQKKENYDLNTLKLTPPIISSVSPSTGIPGTTVTVTGSNFRPIASSNNVSIGGLSATIVSVTPTQIVFVVPYKAKTAPLIVAVLGEGPPVAPPMFTVPAPSLSVLSRSSGIPGDTLTLIGQNYTPGTLGSKQGDQPTVDTVLFNGRLAHVVTASDTKIVVVIPYGNVSGKVTVKANGIVDSARLRQDPKSKVNTFVVPGAVITSATPLTGSAGTSVTIAGNFPAMAGFADSVFFNGINALVTSSSTSQIIATVPYGASTGYLVVRVNGEDSALKKLISITITKGTVKKDTMVRVNDTFTVPVPVIYSVKPSVAAVGSTITIAGDNFNTLAPTTDTVFFNGVSQGVAVLPGSTSISAMVVVPAGAKTGPVVLKANGQNSTNATTSSILNVGP